jgi:hypothetical protein
METLMRWYCTYCDRNYLIRMLAMASSLQRHEQQPFCLFVVCLDELTRTLLDQLQLPGVITIPLHRLEQNDEPLRIARGNRNPLEYFWTLTSTILLRLFEWYPEADNLTYLDADLFFFSTPDPLFDEHPDAPVVIHGHNFAAKYQMLERYGRFNVGLVIFRRSAEGSGIITWWRERCLEWCHDQYEEGKFGDQLYLEQWPERCPTTGILSNPGAGVAPWNQNDYHFNTDQNGTVLVNGTPVIFYHFHSLDIVTPHLYRPSKLLHYQFDLPVLLLCYLPYVTALQQAIHTVQSILPEFSCGISCHSPATPVSHTLLCTFPTAQTLSEHVTGMQRINLGEGWVVCKLPVEAPDPATLLLQ